MNFKIIFDTAWIFILATSLNAIGVSRLWICGGIGLLLPLAVAIFVALAAAVIGNDLIFLAVRSECLRKRLTQVIEKVNALYSKMHIDVIGISGVIFARQIPLPSLVISILLANTKVSHRDYLTGTILGYAPSTVLTVLATSTAAKFLLPHITAMTACAVAVAAGIIWFVKIKRKY